MFIDRRASKVFLFYFKIELQMFLLLSKLRIIRVTNDYCLWFPGGTSLDQPRGTSGDDTHIWIFLLIILMFLLLSSYHWLLPAFPRSNHHKQVKPAIDDIGERVAPVIEGVGQQVHINSHHKHSFFISYVLPTIPKGQFFSAQRIIYWPARDIFNS